MGNGLPFQVDWLGKAFGYLGEEPFQTEETPSTKALQAGAYLFKELFKEQQAGVELATCREYSKKWGLRVSHGK